MQAKKPNFVHFICNPLIVSGKKFAEFRRKSGKTQSEMARDLDVHRNTIANWERAERVPRLVALLVNALD
ncbi:MAG: helix-turn-helix domain-containing protein [Ilumatobacteraceae bacterium]